MNEVYEIKLGKEKTIEALVKAGKYDWSNSEIKEFPFEKTEAKEIELIHFGRDISSEDAIKEMDEKGLRPATATELLLLGAQHPGRPKTNPTATEQKRRVLFRFTPHPRTLFPLTH